MMRLKTIMESLGLDEIQDIIDEILYSLGSSGEKGPTSSDALIMDDRAFIELSPWPPNSRANAIRIERLKVVDDEQDKGLGSKIMNIICHIADTHQISLVLSAMPFGDKGMDADNLIKFYQKFGFEMASREDKKSLGMFGDVMIRRYIE